MNKIKSIENKGLAEYISRQLNYFFPDNKPVSAILLLSYIDLAEENIFHCFEGIRKKYFNEGDKVLFTHLQSDQYCMLLYMLSNFIYTHDRNAELATKIYYLNKAMHSVDIYFTTKLPGIFLFVHPLGTILGPAEFSDYFICYQGCTVGCLNEGIFPVFTGKTIMYSNSAVLGKCTIGENVCVAAGTRIINTDIPDNKIVRGNYPDYIFADNNKDIFQRPPFLYGNIFP
jgi:serine O-acetyltransferase